MQCSSLLPQIGCCCCVCGWASCVLQQWHCVLTSIPILPSRNETLLPGQLRRSFFRSSSEWHFSYSNLFIIWFTKKTLKIKLEPSKWKIREILSFFSVWLVFFLSMSPSCNLKCKKCGSKAAWQVSRWFPVSVNNNNKNGLHKNDLAFLHSVHSN